MCIRDRLKPLAEMIRVADKPLVSLDREAGKKEILNAVLNAFATAEGTEAVAYSLESVRASLPAGEIHASQLFESLPWTGAIQRLELTPEEIRQLANIKTLVVYVRSAGAAESNLIPLVTSRYFATLIAERLGIPAERISMVAESESEFLKSLDLAARAEEFFFGEMEGWEPLK
jgi:2',3'-cyclic-nucleotide 2'-phosphodiesterase (5'-nucleotidase family)